MATPLIPQIPIELIEWLDTVVFPENTSYPKDQYELYKRMGERNVITTLKREYANQKKHINR